MKTQKRLVLISLLTLAALLVVAAPVAARAAVTRFTQTESCTPTNPGTWTTLPSGRIMVRGMVMDCREDSSDPRETGNNIVTMNANWDSQGLGPMWGTSHFATDEGGLWKATWAGMVTAQGAIYHAESKGEGKYQGLKAWVNSMNGSNEGRILDPHGD